MKSRNFWQRIVRPFTYFKCLNLGHYWETDSNYPTVVTHGSKCIERFVHDICTFCYKRQHKDNYAGGLVMSRRLTLCYGSWHGFGYGWLSRGIQKRIVGIWNWLICPLTGHDWFGDFHPKRGAVRYPDGSFTYVQKICSDCCRTKNESGKVEITRTRKV